MAWSNLIPNAAELSWSRVFGPWAELSWAEFYVGRFDSVCFFSYDFLRPSQQCFSLPGMNQY